MSVNKKLTAIADKIREHSGSTSLFSLDAMPDAIDDAVSAVITGVVSKTATKVHLGDCDVVGEYAFYGCTSMKCYDFSNCTKVPTLKNKNAFTGIPNNCEILVSPALYQEWIAAENWSHYADHIIPYCAHEYAVTEIVAPTCETDGYTIYTCPKCGHSRKDNIIPALGHDLLEDGRDATCTSGGWYRAVCQREGCGYHEEDTTPALGHDMSEPIVDVEPTCTESGTWHAYCRRCGYGGYGTTPALGHDMAGDVIVEPTCGEAGEYYALCQRDGCNYEETTEIPATGEHTWELHEDGTSVYNECTVCGAIESIA